MRDVRAFHHCFPHAALLLVACQVIPCNTQASLTTHPVLPAAPSATRLSSDQELADVRVILTQRSVEQELAYQERLKRARLELGQRNQARREAGWTPKSWEEQMVTRLSRLQDMRIRKQEQALTRAEFEKARGEVYMQIARDYIKYGHLYGYRRYYGSRYVPGRYTGVIYRPYGPYDYWANDRLALRLGAHFANKAARSNSIAAAQEFHANTYYERLIRNSESRIATLQRKIGFEAKLAGRQP